MIHGSRQRINVYSDPPGARVFLNGQDTKKVTPAVVNVKRSSRSHVIKLDRAGYQTEEHYLHSRFNALVILDFCMWLIPGVVDLAAGAQHTYDKSFFLHLTPSTQTPIAPPISLQNQAYTFLQRSDVDNGIPEAGRTFSNRYALIIGNEDYTSFQRELTSEANVAYARDDASAFKAYAVKTLGIPERNITFLMDATSGVMRQGLTKMNLIAKNSGGDAEVFVFYAGHGLPDGNTKEPYLMPVDVSGKYINLAIPLREFYAQLTEHPTQRVTVFLDACFSGGARNQGLVAARGVRITPKDESVKGNMIVFAASAADESALPYTEKNHGLFTYYLLQKLKDTEGRIKYTEMAEYLEKHVALESVIVNNKEQHPKTILSPEILNTWQTWEFR